MGDIRQLEFNFRGARDYLQGADLYDTVVRELGRELPEGPVSAQFHSFLRTQPDVVMGVQNVSQWRTRSDYRGEMRFGEGSNAVTLVLLASARPISKRLECNEKEVVQGAKVDSSHKSARLPMPVEATPMEATVFLNKVLHFALLPEVREKWLFVRLELNQRLPDRAADQLELRLKQVLCGRFTRVAILIDGQEYGHITFSTLK